MKILMLMMEVGGGHKIPAISIKQAIEKKYPSAEITIMDIAHDLGVKSFDKGVKKWWQLMLKRPLLLKGLYKLTKNKFRLVHLLDSLISRRVQSKFIEFIKKSKPDFIFSTHCTGANIISRLKKKKKFGIPDALLLTDAFDAHPIWTHGFADYYIFYDKGIINDLRKRGIKPKQLVVRNFPLREQFCNKKVNKKNVRKKLDLPDDRLVIIMTAGGEGLSNMVKQVKKYIKANLKIALVVICGKNEKLYGKLCAFSKKIKSENTLLVPRGYVSNMHEYIAASDVTLGKSGTSFTFESLFFSKPFIITQTMANEEGLRNFVVNNKLGWYAPRISKQIQIIKSLIANKKMLREYAKRCRKLNIKNGSSEVADFIVSVIQEHKKTNKNPIL